MNMNDATFTEKNEDMLAVSNDLELEIMELEDKIAPRDWNVYALVSCITK